MLGDPADWTVVGDHLLTCASRALVLLLGAWSLLFAQDGKNLRVVDRIHTPTLLRIVSVGRGPADTKRLGPDLSGSPGSPGRAPAGDMASCYDYSRLLAREKKALAHFLLDVCRGGTARLVWGSPLQAVLLGVILGPTQNLNCAYAVYATLQ